jgi:hypothetical protein
MKLIIETENENLAAALRHVIDNADGDPENLSYYFEKHLEGLRIEKFNTAYFIWDPADERAPAAAIFWGYKTFAEGAGNI